MREKEKVAVVANHDFTFESTIWFNNVKKIPT